MRTANTRTSGWYGFTDAQLWEQLTRCEANVRAYCRRIAEDDPSRDKLIEWLGLAQEWCDRAVSICQDLEARGLAPRGRTRPEEAAADAEG